MKPAGLLDRLLTRITAITAGRDYSGFVRAAADAPNAQAQILRNHFRRHAQSDFGREHGFNRLADYNEFIRAVPIRDYSGFAPYIDRLRRGETAALLGPRQRLLMFALTSGTTAEPKYIPVTQEFLRAYQHGWRVWGVKTLMDHPGALPRGIVQVTSPMRDHVTESGVPCGAITGLLAASQLPLVRRFYVAPLEVAEIADTVSKYYTIMRLAAPRDVSFLVTANPATILQLARTADAHKETLIRDVRDGTLADEFSIPPHVRRALASRLAPDPEAARRLAQGVERFGALRPRDYWNLAFLAHWTGGTMGLYRRYFPNWFGDIPVRDIGLLASEGRMSIPIEDGAAGGVLDVTSLFFEFIPAEEYGGARPTVLRAHELVVGREYFLLLTNASGLTRYDIGDRVRVTGWFGLAPIVEFLSKGAHTSSLTGEKLTEHQAVAAMQLMPTRGQPALDLFVLSPQFAERPFYRLWVDSDLLPEAVRADPEGFAGHFDAALGRLNFEYAARRESDRLGPVELEVLPPRFLTDRDAKRRSAAASRAEQFKHQYLIAQTGVDGDWPRRASPAPSEQPVESGTR